MSTPARQEAGLADESALKAPREGWTRICYSDASARETSGSALVWDLPMAEVRALAQAATRVRIQERGKPSRAVQSKPGAYPIEDVKRGVPIGFMRELRESEVARFWEAAPEGCEAAAAAGVAHGEVLAALAERLWHTNKAWGQADNDKLALRIYQCCDNAKGIHWSCASCGWTHKSLGSTDLELYIDAKPRSDAETFDCGGQVDAGSKDNFPGEVRKQCLKLTMAPGFCISTKFPDRFAEGDRGDIHLWQLRADSHDGSSNQKWIFEDGRIKLAKAPGYCISTKFPDWDGDRGVIHLWQLRADSHDGSGNQKWIFEDGRMKLAKAPGYCIHIKENDPGNGVKVHLRQTLADSHKDSGNQKWHFSSQAAAAESTEGGASSGDKGSPKGKAKATAEASSSSSRQVWLETSSVLDSNGWLGSSNGGRNPAEGGQVVTLAGQHWIITVGDKMYQAGDFANNGMNKAWKMQAHAGNLAAGMFPVGTTSKTDADIAGFVERWNSDLKDYHYETNNCHVFAKHLVRFLCNGEGKLPQHHGVFMAMDSNGFDASIGLGEVAAVNVAGSKAAFSGPTAGIQVSGGGAFVKAEAAKAEIGTDTRIGRVGAQWSPNLNTGAGARDGNVEASLLGFGAKAGRDGVGVRTPLVGADCNLM